MIWSGHESKNYQKQVFMKKNQGPVFKTNGVIVS